MQNQTLSKLITIPLSFSLVVGVLTFSSCGDETTPPDQTNQGQIKTQVDSTRSSLLAVNGAVFSIPSPIQTALLLKKVGANYNKDILNNPDLYSNYSTRFKKAINLGVYGADLGYVTMYEQTQDALKFLGAVRKMGDELGITGAFDANLINRFEQNMGNRDSLLVLVADAYRSSDNYLKNNQNDDLGALIIAGGWIESLYFATNVAKQSDNSEIIRRIGEQQKTLENLIKLLSPHYNDASFTAFIDSLINLSEDFDQIQFSYIHEDPTVIPANKTTIINSRTEFEMTKEQLESITRKVETIRNQIVG